VRERLKILIGIILALIGSVWLAFGAVTPPPSSGGGGNGGTYSLPTLKGGTNYFAPAANTPANGPISYYRVVGSSGLTNLMMDVFLGRESRFNMQFSQDGYEGAYGSIFMNPDHDAAGAPAYTKSEMQFSAGAHFAFLFGNGSPTSGHIQFGAIDPFSSGYGTYNQFSLFYGNMLGQGLSQSSPTGFSGGIVFPTFEYQGANLVGHYPGMAAFSIKTNASAPRWGFVLSSEYQGGGQQLWDPNTMKANRWVEWQAGDTNVMIVQSNMWVGGYGMYPRGVVVKSNTPATIPTLQPGDTYYWSSNGVAYVTCSSPSGALTTTKLGP